MLSVMLCYAEGNVINNEKSIKQLLWITIDDKLPFELHLNKISKKLSHKIHTLARTSTNISQKKL